MKRTTAKESTSRLFNRYIWLIDLITRKQEITYEEINNHWLRSPLNEDEKDFPLRTFHNHREAIAQMFDIDIECDTKNGYKYYIPRMEDIAQNTLRSWLLNTFTVGNLLQEKKSLHHRILLENVPSGREFLGQIVEAMKENLKLIITHQSFFSDSPSQVVIHPYCIKIFKQRWYVIAHKETDNALRIYALDRIKELKITNETFEIPNDFEADTLFENNFGIIIDDSVKLEKITLKVKYYTAKYLNSLPLHHSQKEIKTEGEYTFFEYFLRPTFDFRQEILSHGAEIEVLSPESFRNEIKEIVSQMQGFYK
ncbi:helix-turn-helix transcriptional regulator [Capnocytophaga stomatis]|uniref:WYL domain-containing protein n=1 Tax=Capnocytophaga stomatis TaxID=1848904 RepID=A0A250FTK0_9FLAO|nr:WYL domain-containing protein [Capnocytophaga stomatis]ATA88482.1 WYL domain-containing protein [Capnocytophaga stomatis]